MKDQKKTWIKPQLVVIGRGRPEEKILAACKQAGQPSIDPFTDCVQLDGSGKCSGIGQS
jgi:hypothetical protein